MSSIITILVTQLDWQVDIIYTFTAHFANVDLTQEPSFICLSYLFFVIGWILVCPMSTQYFGLLCPYLQFCKFLILSIKSYKYDFILIMK